MMKLKANYFSGKISRRETAIVSIYKDLIEVAVNGNLHTFKINECEVSDIFPNRPAVITLPDDSRIELFFSEDQYNDLKDLISKQSHFFQFKYILILLTFTLISIVISFKFIIPSMSSKISKMIPDSMSKRIDHLVIDKLNMDKNLNSKLPEGKQKELRDFLLSKTNIKVKVYFKNFEDIGANAFALSYESIVITDKLVELVKSKELLLPIFLHEVGHIKNKHVLNQLVSSFTFQAFLIFTTGQSDLMSSVTNIATSMAVLKYSRDLELEADQYALNTLGSLQYSPACFAKSFEVLSNESQKENILHLEYLSTHPNSELRIQNAYKIKKSDKYLVNCNEKF